MPRPTAFTAMLAVLLTACGTADTLPVETTPDNTTTTATTSATVQAQETQPAEDPVPPEDCEPTTESGRRLSGGEWALLSAFLSDEDTTRTLSSEGITGEVQGSQSWCQLRDHPTYSVGYWAIADDLDGLLQVARLACEVDPDTETFTCPETENTGNITASSAPTVTVATPVDYPTTSVTGSGSRVVDLEIAGGGLCTITMTVTGNVDESFGVAVESNFFVEQVDPPSFDPLWVFGMLVEEGTWEKAVRFDPVESGAVTLEVTAEGDWTIESDCRG